MALGTAKIRLLCVVDLDAFGAIGGVVVPSKRIAVDAAAAHDAVIVRLMVVAVRSAAINRHRHETSVIVDCVRRPRRFTHEALLG